MKKTSRAIHAFALSLALIGCSSATVATTPPAAAPSVPPPTVEPPAPTPAAQPPRNDRWVEETLARLTLRQKVGQMIVPRISGAYMSFESPEYQRLYDWVVRQGIGGVIITQGPMFEIAAKLNTLQQLANVPLLVSADMENGPGQILSSGYILPTASTTAARRAFPR